MDDFKPFADDDASFGIGDLTIENGQDRIAVYGNLDLARDKQGLAAARTLKAFFERAVRALESDAKLPDALAPAVKPQAPAAPADPLALPTGGLAPGG